MIKYKIIKNVEKITQYWLCILVYVQGDSCNISVKNNLHFLFQI